MQPAGRPVRSLLRLEGLAFAIVGLTIWAAMDGGWARFALFVLVPDLAMVGYFWGPRVGAACYNATHSYALPLLIGLAGGMLDHRVAVLTAALWMTHIGVDRALGYGLKYPTAFRDTHLGQLGRGSLPGSVSGSLSTSLLRTGEHLAHLISNADRTSGSDGVNDQSALTF